MHCEAFNFFADEMPDHLTSVLECGGRDVNGGLKDLLAGADSYCSVDIEAGPGVDVVADFAGYTPPEPVGLVLCAEVYEHAANWRELVASAARALEPGGLLLATCAGPRRAPHSAVDGNALRPGEFYRNLERAELEAELLKHFRTVRVAEVGEDLQARAEDPYGRP